MFICVTGIFTISCYSGLTSDSGINMDRLLILTSVKEKLDKILLVQFANTVVNPEPQKTETNGDNIRRNQRYGTMMRRKNGQIQKPEEGMNARGRTTSSHQGQWWSMRRMHLWQTRQWCALGGRYVSQRLHTVHPSQLWKPHHILWVLPYLSFLSFS